VLLQILGTAYTTYMGFQEEPQLPGTVLLPGPGSVQIGSVREIGGSTQKKKIIFGDHSVYQLFYAVLVQKSAMVLNAFHPYHS
jgi:hypothetical protein